MKQKISVYIAVALIGLISCKKNGTTPPNNNNNNTVAKCLLATESANMPGYAVEGRYEYNTDKKPVIIRWFHSSGVELKYKEVIYASPVAIIETNIYSGTNKITTKYFYNTGSELPATAERYLNGGANDVLGGYDFHYDTKNRLVKVVQGTPMSGDWEYTLHIFYNDNDNVIRLEYERTTGPRIPNILITVAAYDDKPSMYANQPTRKFLMDATWDNSEALPIITALSKNNPLEYTSTGLQRKMTYAYNQHGFPITRTNTEIINGGTPVVYADSFTYNCN